MTSDVAPGDRRRGSRFGGDGSVFVDADPVLRRDACRLRSRRSRERRPVRQQARFRDPPQLSAHVSRRAAGEGRDVDAPAVGGSPAGGEVLEADSGGGEPRQCSSLLRRRALHRRVQHLDASRRGFERDSFVSAEASPAVALEPSRPDQGRLHRCERRARQAARHHEGDGADRDANHSRLRGGQPAGRLESGDQRGAGHDGQGLRPPGAVRKKAGKRIRTRRPLRQAPCRVPGTAAGRRVVSFGADPDRTPFRGEPADPRSSCEENAGGCSGFPRGSARRSTRAEAARPKARTVRHLVRRVPRARQIYGGAT